MLSDLELMRDAAFESYGIVRGVLEAMHPETTQTLTNLLLEHARKISQRADIDIDFKTKGKPYSPAGRDPKCNILRIRRVALIM